MPTPQPPTPSTATATLKCIFDCLRGLNLRVRECSHIWWRVKWIIGNEISNGICVCRKLRINDYLLFYAYHADVNKYIYIFRLLLVWMSCVGLYSLYRLSNDILKRVFKCFERSIRLIYFGKVSFNRILSILISVPIIISYLVTRHWLVSNIVAVSITLMMF